MCLKQYKLDLFLTKTSCKIILEKLKNNTICDEQRRKLMERYDVLNKEHEAIKDYLLNWLIITKETLLNVQKSIVKIEQSKSKNIEKKNRYIKKLNAHVSFLKKEIEEYYNDCYEQT